MFVIRILYDMDVENGRKHKTDRMDVLSSYIPASKAALLTRLIFLHLFKYKEYQYRESEISVSYLNSHLEIEEQNVIMPRNNSTIPWGKFSWFSHRYA